MKAKPGDQVELELKEQKVSGTLMPSTDRGYTVIKLDNGYNIGISNKRVKSVKLVRKYKQKSASKKGLSKKKGLPTISILHLGGTIASKVDYSTGAVTAAFSPEEILSMFPELSEIANIKSRLVRQMMSENIRLQHYNIIAKEIEKEVKAGADGVIVTHGTDTLHYTSAALAFILEKLPVPVLVVGAQRSSDRGSSDAAYNLLSAATFIANSDFAEVAVCMHKNLEDDICVILPGTKVRKMHTSRRDAFRPVNAKPYAEVHYKKKHIKLLRDDFGKRSDQKIDLKLFDQKLKVGVLKSHPGLMASELSSFKGYQGVVIEGTGLGHLPITKIDQLTEENQRIFRAARKLSKEGTLLVMGSQCLYGRVDMNVYSEGRKALEIGIQGNFTDMTPETAYIKLAWLLSNYSKSEVKQLVGKNLRGEISERTERDTFLI